MSNWDSYTNENASMGGGSIPVVEDGLYDAVITEIGEVETRPNPFPQRPGEKFYEAEQVQFRIKFTLEDPELPEDTWYGYWVNLPYGIRNGSGSIGENSKVFEVMTALGLVKQDQPIRFRPPEWVGLKARVMVEAKTGRDGEPRCRITSVKPARGRKPVVKAGGLRDRLTRDEVE